ncbi:unnamed protein product [Zymoseptoria tritici ST99CH_3D7]|uniref:Uncharacterized protein n=1 Tax=Zymoseptoria tritici (strain ST99CH_3D7) TaxID=1276538 RepID=A0A1X7RTL9_ZYMT9|nr:unnamed protein product [Zymoseptoria tritici ST99CH_3D7]
MSDTNATRPTAASTNDTLPAARRVLGDVSPNVRTAAGIVTSKPMLGSPLKRSFTAAMNGGNGFTYFKKRKFSNETPLSQAYSPEESRLHAQDENEGQLGSGFDQASTLVPTIQNCSPTEPGTPNGSVDGNSSSGDRKSFSSLINYDPSSQTHASQPTVPGLVFSGPSYAEQLRLRLRVAMYKVQTDQVDVPFTDLQIEEDFADRTPTAEEVEGAVADLRREAQASLQAKQSRAKMQAVPKLLPAPTLVPTAYSSRMIYDAPMPSSPPVQRSPARLPMGVKLETPAKRALNDESELTSSVVKGRVAEGLLGLRNAHLRWME